MLCVHFARLETFLSRSRHVSLSRWLACTVDFDWAVAVQRAGDELVLERHGPEPVIAGGRAGDENVGADVLGHSKGECRTRPRR